MKKNILIASLVAMVSIAIAPRLSFAQTADAAGTANVAGVPASPACKLSAADFAAITAVQNDPSLSADQEFTQELALRKKLLAETIACAIGDATTLQQALGSVSSTDGGVAVQSQLAGRVNDAITFYHLESAKLDGAGIAGTEAIARDVVAWRAANYVPLEGQVNDFLLWSQNQSLFQTAQARVTQTGQLVSFIESATPNSDLQNSFDAAQSAFEDAASANSQAENDLAQFLPPDQSLALIQQSLQSLADAYQAFADVNTLVQKLLPTSGS